MTRAAGALWLGAATLLAVLAVLGIAWAALGPAAAVPDWEVALTAVDLVPVALGWLVYRRAAPGPVGPVLAWMGAATVAVRAVEFWGESAAGPAPLWGAGAVAHVAPGVWPWQLMGFLAVMLVFPTGLLPGRAWRVVAVAGPLAAAMITVGLVDSSPGTPPLGWRTPLVLAGMAVLLAALGGSVVSLVVRYRRGDEPTRLQLRWLLAAAASVPVLLAAGWVAVELGLPGWLAYSGFLFGMLVLVPAAIALSILRHDLFGIDQLVSASVAWLLTSVVSAGIFAAAVWLLGGFAPSSGLGAAAAAFVTALCLLPLHQRLHAAVGRVFDRERTVMLATVRDFVERLREGRDQPEQVEAVLRVALRDPAARLALAAPGRAGFVDLRGEEVTQGPDQTRIDIQTHEARIGVLLLGRATSRHRRMAVQAVQAARLPIEVSRLRLELRAALADVTTSRSRLVAAVAEERRRLERDLHDGAQQRVVAVGMRLRSLQRRLGHDDGACEELDLAVLALEDTVAELRRIAHGVRPRQLDDGLSEALRALALASPLPLQLDIGELTPDDLDETRATTAYLVVAEALANAWKHSGADHVQVLAQRRAGVLHLEVADDGRGGIDPATGLTGLRDRVASVGGTLEVVSPVGGGTRLTVAI